MSLSSRYPQKRAFITGAASGFGLALAEHLAAEGWALGLADLNGEVLSAVAERLEAAGVQVHSFAFDVADAGAFEAAASQFLAATGGIDVVINNAGIAVAGAMEETSVADWEAIIGVNLMGVVHGCRLFIPAMKEAGAGHLINVASAAAFAAGPRMASYNATKAGVLALSETLYGELREAGVDVSVVMPTFFQTNIGKAQRSTEVERAITERLLRKSKHTAAEVAAHVLEAAGKRKVYILFPREAWKMWQLKRFFPKRHLKTLVRINRATIRYLARKASP